MLQTGDVLREQNFGVVGITWDAGNTRIELQARDLTGKPRIEKTLRLGDLRQYPSL